MSGGSGATGPSTAARDGRLLPAGFSFAPQGDDGIDAQRAAAGEVAGEERHREQQG